MLFGKNYSGLGQITNTVVGSPYKEKNNWKEVKSCGSAVEPIWQKAFIRVRKGLFKINISRGVGSFAYELQDEEKNQSTVLPKSHSPGITPDTSSPHAWTEQCCGFCPTSWPRHMRLCQWLRPTKHLHWGHNLSAGGRNMTSSWVLLHSWNLYNMLLPPPAILWWDRGGLTHWGNKNTPKMWAWSCPRDKTKSQTQYL